ncbi:MAG: thioredoxin [Bifidobacteriaceae bacterium]|jgi:thioredoxin|nr:thioredoxin [Bifidobacteriaceae bacterium]
MEIIHLTNENFEQIKNNAPILIVDFWASWCVPCKQFAPIFEKIAANNPDIQFAKVDVDSNKETAMDYGILSIPTILAFKNGENAFSKIGAMKPDEFEKLITDLKK